MAALNPNPGSIRGKGTNTPPEGIAPKEAQRLAREADEARLKENN